MEGAWNWLSTCPITSFGNGDVGSLGPSTRASLSRATWSNLIPVVRRAPISECSHKALQLSATQILIYTFQTSFSRYFIEILFYLTILITLHSDGFAWRQAELCSPLFRFAVGRIPRVPFQRTAVNIGFLFTILKEYAGNLSLRLADKGHIK
jgi:hypothetical protein